MAANADIAADRILGVWKLISVDVFADENPESKSLGQPLGPNPLGRIMFTPYGYMNATLTNPDIAQPTGTVWAEASNEDVVRAARPMVTYCGPYKIYMEGDEVRLETTVDISLDPSWLGTPQIRRVSFSENNGVQCLVLKPVQPLVLPNGTKAFGVLRWEKIMG